MNFRPDSEDAVQEKRGGGFEPLPAGAYWFEVRECTEGKSKSSGNDQFALTLTICDSGESAAVVFDYLPFTEKMKWKFRHAMYAVGMGAEYESGEVEAMDFVGKSGKVLLKIRPANGQYPAKNEVEDYIVPEDVSDPRQGDLPF